MLELITCVLIIVKSIKNVPTLTSTYGSLYIVYRICWHESIIVISDR